MKSSRLDVRIDENTKQKLMEVSEALGISASTLVCSLVKEMLRNGDAYFLMPEHLRETFDEELARRERLKTYLDLHLKRRKMRQANAYIGR